MAVLLNFKTETKEPTVLNFRTEAIPSILSFRTEDTAKTVLSFSTEVPSIVLAFRTMRELEEVDLGVTISDDCKTVTVTLPEPDEDTLYAASVENLLTNTLVDHTVVDNTVIFTTEKDGIFSLSVQVDGETIIVNTIPVLCRAKKCAGKANLKDVRNLEKCRNRYSSRLVDLMIRGIEANSATGDIATALGLLDAVNEVCSDNCSKCLC